MTLRGKKYLKNLDKYVGVPLLFFFSIIRVKRKLPNSIRNIGIMLVPAIGDIILISGLLEEIKQKYNNSTIHLFVPSDYENVLLLIKKYDSFTKINLSNPIKTLGLVRKNTFDIFIDASQWARLPALISVLSKSRYTIGFKSKGQGKHFAFDKAVEHSSKVHEFLNLKGLFFSNSDELNDIPMLNIDYNIPIDEKKIIIHIAPSGSKSERKELPIHHWKIIVEYLLKKDLNIYFTGSEADKNKIDNLIDTFKSEKLFNVAGTLSITETAKLLKSSKLVISVNTGTMHIASFLRCNLIAIHGPTNSQRWGPLNDNSIVINSPYPEAPCLDLGFDYNCKDRDGKCMKAIKPEIIIEGIEKFINQTAV
jgi:ADP-heptose:LPS heptosyltransferase